MLCINKDFLAKHIFNYIVKQILQSIKIRDIDNATVSFSKYVILKIVIFDKIDDCIVVDKIRCQIYIVKDLKINMLIDFDIMNSENINVDYRIFIIIIDSCRDIKISTIVIFAEKIQRIV